MITSVCHSFNAKREASKMVNGDTPQKYVSRDEFEVYDTIKKMSMITFFLFGKIMAIGKCGKWMIWRNRSAVTGRLAKKTCFGFVLVILMSLWAMKEHNHIKHIVKQHHHEQGPPSWPPMEDGEVFNVENNGRHLKAVTTDKKEDANLVFLGDDEATCSALGAEGSCNANAVCSWCVSAAVKPACHSTENAKTLPPAVFTCSKVESLVPKKPVEIKKPVNPLKDDEDDCNALGSDT